MPNPKWERIGGSMPDIYTNGSIGSGFNQATSRVNGFGTMMKGNSTKNSLGTDWYGVAQSPNGKPAEERASKVVSRT